MHSLVVDHGWGFLEHLSSHDVYLRTRRFAGDARARQRDRCASHGRLRATARGGSERLSVLVVARALIGSVFCAGLLLFVRFDHWAGAHPFAGTLLIVLAVPVPYVALRAMPRARPPEPIDNSPAGPREE